MSSWNVSEPNYESRQGEGDEEKHAEQCSRDAEAAKESAFKSLGWLDRLLALWILLAMVVGILLGNFVPDVDKTLAKGEFVSVSVPIGEYFQ